MKVLFIDPEEQTSLAWADRLKIFSSDYDVLHAADGHSGLSLLRTEQVDCVVLELNQLDNSGLSLLLNLVPRVRHPDLPIVVLTNFDLAALFPLAIQHGAHSCLVKSQTSVEDLDRAIRKAIAVVGPKKNRSP